MWFATCNKMSLKHCNKCLWIFMVALLFDFTEIIVSRCNFIWMFILICTTCVCCRFSDFWLCTHSLYHPWLSTERVRRTPKGTPTVVRRGQTDWVHRLLCGLPRVHRGPRTLLPGAPLIAGLRAPHRAVIRLWPLLPVEWMDVLRPCWDGVSIGVMMLGSRGTIF